MTGSQRILYVVPRWNQPTETFVRREVAAALAAGTSVQVVSLRSPAPSDGIVDDSMVRVVTPTVMGLLRGLPTALGRPRPTLTGLGRALRLGRRGTRGAHVQAWLAAIAVEPQVDTADVVVAHFAWLSATVADNLAAIRRRPYAVFVHAHDIYETRCQDRYLTDRLTRAGVVFVESERIAGDVRDAHGVEPIVMRMGIPAEYVASAPASSRPRTPFVVVSVGALREKKGHDVLIRAVSALDNVHLRIAGEGPERERLEALITTLDVADRVSLLGHLEQPEIRRLLGTGDAFCLASRPTASGDRDGVPNVLIEAMGRGVPVIATDFSGIPDLLDDDCGLIVAPNDVDALIGAIEQTRSVPDGAERRARRALDRIRADYTTAINWNRMASCLDQVAGAHG